MTNCGYCHECGTKLQTSLDGEEWCRKCGQYKRYPAHGWGHNRWNEPDRECPPRKIIEVFPEPTE